MSDAGEQLLFMSSPKTTCYDGASRRTAQDRLKPADIAAALSYLKMSDFETRYIMAALLQSEPWGPKSTLGMDAWLWAVDIAIREKWQIPQGSETVRRLSFLALASRIDRRQFVCQSCNGVGTVLNTETNRLDQCNHCAGTTTDRDTGRTIGNGMRGRSDRFYGRALGVNHETYKSTWRPRLHNLIADLQAIEGRVVTHIRRVVFD